MSKPITSYATWIRKQGIILNQTIQILKKCTKVLDALQTWCKPKFNEIAAFVPLSTLKQDSQSVRIYQKCKRLVDDCSYPDNATDRLLRDLTGSEVALAEAYRKCSYSSQIKLNSEDSTRRQDVALWPDLVTSMIAGTQDSNKLHKVTFTQKLFTTYKKAKRLHTKDCTHYKHSTWHSGSKCPVQDSKCYKFKRMGLSRPQQSLIKSYQVKLYMRLRNKKQKTASQNTLLPIIYPWQKHSRHQQSQYAKYSLIQHQGNTCRQIWQSQSLNSNIQQIDCEVDTSAGWNTLQLYKAQTLLGTE